MRSLNLSILQVLALFFALLPLSTLAAPVKTQKATAANNKGKTKTPTAANANAGVKKTRKIPCGDPKFKEGPCVCGTRGKDALGLRLKNLGCEKTGRAFKFVNPATTSPDGTLKQTTDGALGENLECDHIVELQVIADKIGNDPAICQELKANNNAKFKQFFDTINAPESIIFIPKDVNNIKGIVFGGKSLGAKSLAKKKDISGLSSYLNQLKTTNPALIDRAQVISDKLNSLVPAGKGFNFQADYTTLVNQAIAKIDKLVPAQTPAATPAPPTTAAAGTANSCALPANKTKRSLWEAVKELAVRAVTGKKATGSTAAACTLPKTTSTKASTAPVKTSNTAAKGKTTTTGKSKSTATKATQAKTTAKKPVSAKTVAKKPAAKPVAKKPATKTVAKKPAAKTVAKKPATKTVAKKPATKSVAKKPVAKTAAKKPAAKTVATKPVKKPVVKKPVAKKTAVKKPAVKKPVAKKTAVKKPVVRKTAVKSKGRGRR